VLLIDGLDECDTRICQVEMLRLIGTSLRQYPNTVRFLIASRPEAHIRGIFEDVLWQGLSDSANVEQSFEDVEIYLRDEFARIHREHKNTMSTVQIPWPSPDILHDLLQKSSGYFVYASTVVQVRG
ncbi:hypothetical protein C8R47DRAFT_994239, partial [Mycena vitilis]